VFVKFSVKIPIADSQTLRSASAVAVAGLERRPDVFPKGIAQVLCRESRSRIYNHLEPAVIIGHRLQLFQAMWLRKMQRMVEKHSA
jgi:hypothetical protein